MALAPSAIAERGHYTVRPGYVTKVQLQGSNGYRVQVSTGHRHGATVTTRRAGRVTDYGVKGVENGKYGASARFPGFGHVRFRFVPNGRQRRLPPQPWCKGPDGLLLDGVVRGSIRFTGEGGYTRVATKRAEAAVETWPRMRCRYSEPAGRSSRQSTATFEAFRESSPSVFFSMSRHARQSRPRSKQVVFQAYFGRSRGPVGIFHTASVATDASSFVVPDPKAAPENFRVTPPPPFSGTATFQRTPESVFSWEGDLSIQFPGTAPIALTGPDFNTNYCALRGCASQNSPSVSLVR